MIDIRLPVDVAQRFYFQLGKQLFESPGALEEVSVSDARVLMAALGSQLGLLEDVGPVKIRRASAVSMMEGITLNVRVTRVRELRVRTWIAMRLIRLAAWIMNCNICIEESANDSAF